MYKFTEEEAWVRFASSALEKYELRLDDELDASKIARRADLMLKQYKKRFDKKD